MTDAVFLDTECTGLGHDADIWEFAGVRRHVGGSRSELHMFIEHDKAKAARLPKAFHADYAARCLVDTAELVPQRTAARRIWEFIGYDAVVVGAVVAFDSQRLAALFSRHRMPPPPWLYTVVDVCALGAGYLRARGEAVEFPAQVEEIGRRLGIDVDGYERHTAMGDALFVEDIFDRCTLRPAPAQLRTAA